MQAKPNFVTERQLDSVLDEIQDHFPTFVGGVVVDRNGFLMAARDRSENQLPSNLLGLAAVADRKIEGISDRLAAYQQVRRHLGRDGVQLFVVLEKRPRENLPRFNALRKILARTTLDV